MMMSQFCCLSKVFLKNFNLLLVVLTWEDTVFFPPIKLFCSIVFDPRETHALCLEDRPILLNWVAYLLKT